MDHRQENRSRCARVIIVDSQPMYCDGLRRLLANEPDFAVCGEAYTLLDAQRLIRELRPDIAIVGLTLQDGDGLLLLHSDERDPSQPSILLLKTGSEADAVAIAAMRLGAKGVLSTQADGKEILNALQDIRAGRVHLNSSLIRALAVRPRWL